MYDLTSIKSKLSCADYLQSRGIPARDRSRIVSPIRPGADNPTSFLLDGEHWWDFGSATGGDVIDLCAQLEFNGDVGKAIRALADRCGLTAQYSEDYSNWHAAIQKLCDRTAYYHSKLTESDYAYLEKRGLKHDDVERLMIGRVTDGYLRGRLFLPYFKNGGVVYYATRAMPGGAMPDSKYMKASKAESVYYENVPWGLQTLDRGNDLLIISEGYFDAASWENEGYSVLSAITGNFSAEQIPQLISACRAFKKVLMIFDNDPVSHAGAKFTERNAQILFKNHIPFLVSHTPEGVKDVNDYYAGGGDLKKLVDSAQDGMTYMMSMQNTPEDLERFVLSINRFTPPVTIKNALAQVRSKFDPTVMKAIARSAENAPSESKIADEVIKKYDLRYVDKVGYYRWTGKIWERLDDTVVKSFIDQQYGKMFTTAQRVRNVFDLAKNRCVLTEEFDRRPVVPFNNGTLEVTTGVFRDHSPNDYCSILLDYDYDPGAGCPLWKKFITDVTDDEPHRQDILQMLAGYVLMPDCRYQKIFVLTGNGGNGKSVYLDMIERLFGQKNVSHVEPTGVTQDFQRIQLKDSLLNIGSDINSDFKGEIREWLLKVADGTTITACYKGKDYLDFRPRCKLIYATNAVPTAELSAGLNRRLQFVAFPCKFVDYPSPSRKREKQKDVHITEKLIKELPGIFNWAYAGYRSLVRDDHFPESPEQQKLLSEFEEQSNPVRVFCEDYGDRYEGEVFKANIYEDYKNWCMDTGHRAFSREKFIPKFEDVFADRIIRAKRVRRDGVQVRVYDIAPAAPPENAEPVVDIVSQIKKDPED